MGYAANIAPAAVSNITDDNGLAIFTVARGGGNFELWSSDGSTVGTKLLADLDPSYIGAQPKDFLLTPFNGKVYYFDYTSTSAFSQQLWVTDGSASGTKAVSTTTTFTAVHGTVVFNGALYVVDAYGLWKFDGATISKVASVSTGSTPAPVLFNNHIYFAGSTTGTPLYSSDGTSAGTIPAPGASWPSSSMAVSGARLFRAGQRATGTSDDTELWASDGSSQGFYEIKDIRAGSGSSSPINITDIGGGKVFFAADDGVHGSELFESDGTADGTYLVKDINPGSASSSPSNFVPYGGEVYFAATSADGGRELWVSDGTDAGTHLVNDFYAGAGNGSPVPFASSNDGLLVSAVNSSAGFTLYQVTAPNAMPVPLQDLNSGPLNLNVPRAVTSDDSLYLVGGQAAASGDELYRTAGSGVSLVRDIASGPNGSSITSLSALGTRVIFSATTVSTGAEPWVSDGTAGGTVILHDINPGTASSSPYRVATFNGQVYLEAQTDSAGSVAVWRTDGTPAGTTDWIDGGIINGSVELGGKLYYLDGSGNVGRTDGSTRVSVQSGRSAANLSAPNTNTLYFSANGAGSGKAVWKSDGTAAGTAIVKDFSFDNSILSGASPRTFMGANGWVFFIETDADYSFNLWRSNGTAIGTTRMKDVSGMPPFSSPSEQISAFGKLFFTASDAVHGQELWVTDGSAAGTMMLKDIAPGTADSNPRNFVRAGNWVFFTAFDPDHGRELWATDGTPSGTFRVTDLAVGAASSDPQNLIATNAGALYFTANDGVSPKVYRIAAPQGLTQSYQVSPGGSVMLEPPTELNDPSEVLQYSWDLDGDGIFGETGSAAGRGDETVPTPTVSAEGLSTNSIPVAVRVQDSTGLYSVNSTSVTVGEIPGITRSAGEEFSLISEPSGTVKLSFTGNGSGSTALVDQNLASALSGSTVDVIIGGATGGNVVFTVDQDLASLDLQSGDVSLSSSAAGPALTAVGQLSIADGTVLDIGGGSLILNVGATATDALRSYLAAAYDSGKWDGTGGITSSYAAANAGYGVGYGTAADGVAGVATGQVLLKAALVGDTTLKGSVGFGDYQNLLANFGKAAGATWAQGDVNYDGAVTFGDYQALLGNFGKTAAVVPPPAAVVPAVASGGDAAATESVAVGDPPAGAQGGDAGVGGKVGGEEEPVAVDQGSVGGAAAGDATPVVGVAEPVTEVATPAAHRRSRHVAHVRHLRHEGRMVAAARRARGA